MIKQFSQAPHLQCTTNDTRLIKLKNPEQKLQIWHTKHYYKMNKVFRKY
jgi:hypothetical protein